MLYKDTAETCGAIVVIIATPIYVYYFHTKLSYDARISNGLSFIVDTKHKVTKKTKYGSVRKNLLWILYYPNTLLCTASTIK